MRFHADAADVLALEHGLGRQLVGDTRVLDRQPAADLLDVPGPFLLPDDPRAGRNAGPRVREDAVRRAVGGRHRNERCAIDIQKNDQLLEPRENLPVVHVGPGEVGRKIREERFEAEPFVERLARLASAASLYEQPCDQSHLNEKGARENPAVGT
jgi:hypothetical protein